MFSAKREIRNWVFGANRHLPPDIRVLWAQKVPEEFHARRSAVSRQYRYIIYNNQLRPALLRNQVSWVYRKLDHEKMHQAAQSWLGRHDFSSFRASGCQSQSPIREVLSVKVTRLGDLVIFDIIATAFLYHMVRNMVGTLIAIGTGIGSGKDNIDVSWAKEVLEARDRTIAETTAVAEGLYFARINYPEHFKIINTKVGPWFL